MAVVVITVGRKSLIRAIRSIFNQNYTQPIQILIGVDVDLTNNITEYQTLLENECPSHITLTWINLGYSTSIRHGSVHNCFYGGSLRSALTLLADSNIVSYLDDDDWFLPNHISTMTNIFDNFPDIYWAHSLCYYADGNTGEAFCLDEIESVGINKGIYKDNFGGFVRPSGLTINKLKNLSHIHLLSESMNTYGDGEDRLLFNQLKNTHLYI